MLISVISKPVRPTPHNKTYMVSTINPQYTFDNMGNPVGVFLPIEDWQAISEELHLELPGWQKKMIDERLEQYRKNPADAQDWDTIAAQFDKEDEAL
jgi:Putative addiction module component